MYVAGRFIGWTKLEPQGEGNLSKCGAKKRLVYILWNPYRKPTQVDGHECAKVIERNLVQELCKKATVTSG